MDGPQTVAVGHTVGGATATQRMRAQRSRAWPDERSGNGNCGRRSGGQSPQLIG